MGKNVNNRFDQIKKAAIRLFNEYGFKGTSVEMIAQEVGLLKGSLYHHIKSKDDLLLNVFEDVLEDVNATLKQIVDSDLPSDKKLKHAIKNHIEKQIKYFDEYRLYLQERRFLPPKFETKYTMKRKLNESYIDAILEEGIEQGVFRVDLDVRLTTLTLFGMLNWMTQWYKPHGRLSLQEITESISDLALRSITST